MKWIVPVGTDTGADTCEHCGAEASHGYLPKAPPLSCAATTTFGPYLLDQVPADPVHPMGEFTRTDTPLIRDLTARHMQTAQHRRQRWLGERESA